MEELLNQIEKSLDAALYMIALQSSLTLPDICGSLEYPSQGVGKRYITWYNNYYHEIVHHNLPGYKQPLTGEECYYFRCSFVHQASTSHKKFGFDEIAFLDPSGHSSIHNVTLQNSINGKKYICIDVDLFCRSMVSSVRNWLPYALSKTLIKKEYDKLPKPHPEGIPPFFTGVTAIW